MSKKNLTELKASLLRKKSRLKYDDEDDDDVAATATDKGGTGEGDFKPPTSIGVSGLPEGTRSMEIERRQLEQEGHRRLAKVNARVKYGESLPDHGNELQHEEQYQRHPILDSQRFDGVAVDNPDLNNNPDARWIYENERAEQEKEKQLRMEKSLTNQNRKSYSTAPTPKPG